jgi:toxin ParE1/3/4
VRGSKPVVPRALARRDVEEAIDHYWREAGADAAIGFVDSLEAAYIVIGGQPAAGSPRYAHELDLPGLRSILLKRYPYLVFYVERDDYLDVWRILHAHRDIPARLRPPEV